jgi:putative ABC transport system substrate-binding protein
MQFDLKRREVMWLLGSAVAGWPLAVDAQPRATAKLIGVLVHGSQTDPIWNQRLAAFRQELERFGWQEGRNTHFEIRFSANDYERLPQLAQALVAQSPEVIFANTTPATKALQRETLGIPIIFVQVSDPTGAGIVANLARPGGNITGLLFYEDSIAGKWLGMLKEIAPQLVRAALLGNPKGFHMVIFCASRRLFPLG